MADDRLNIAEDHGARPLGGSESARIWRHDGLSGIELFRGSYRRYRFARHYHSVPAIGVVEHGVMASYCRHKNHVVPAGSIILFNPGDVHAPASADGKDWSFRTLFFEDSAYRKYSLALNKAMLRFKKPFIADPGTAARLLHLHRSLEQPGTALSFESALLEILGEIADRHIRLLASTRPISKETDKVKRAKEYIEAYYSKNITLDELAGVSGFGTYHLLRVFRSAVGLTPHAYLIQIRIEAAKKLLLSGATAAATAVSTGFVDQSHFHRHFKRIIGVTPGHYHADVRKGAAVGATA